MNNPGVYILRSLKNGRFYIGSTSDLYRRLEYHNKGLVKATKYTAPFEISVFMPCKDITIARQYELRLKKYKRKDILYKIIADRTFPWDYKRP